MFFVNIVFCQLFAQNTNSNYNDSNNNQIDTLVVQSLIDYALSIQQNCSDSALFYLKRSIALADSLKTNKKVSVNEVRLFNIKKANALRHIGNIMSDYGLTDKTLEYYINSLKLCEEIGYKTGMSACYNNLGAIYQSLGDEKAIDYYMLSLQYDEEAGNRRGVGVSYNNIGLFHIMKGEDENDPVKRTYYFEKAIEFFSKAIEIHKTINEKKEIAICLNNIGIVYSTQGSLTENLNYKAELQEKAIQQMLQSVKILEEIRDKVGMARLYSNIANLLLLQAEMKVSQNEKDETLNEAIDFAKKAMVLSKELNMLPFKRNSANTLMLLYLEKNNYKKAMEYALDYISLKDSLFDYEKTKAIAEIQAKYETNKKQQEIENQRLLIERNELEYIRKKSQLHFALIASSLLVMLIFLLFLGYWQKNKNNAIISKKNKLLNQINKDMTDSIVYAKRIQSSVLLSPKNFSQYFNESFILYIPKNIVSGDFYWITKKENSIIFCVADCTGHGVPGAFMSMLGISFLNEIVGKEATYSANSILNRLRDHVIASMLENTDDSIMFDGMDIGLCILNLQTLELEFAGAYIPCWIATLNPNIEHLGGKAEYTCGLVELKADRMPIARFERMNSFSTVTYRLQPNDTIYLATDGFAHQFGSNNCKKYQRHRLMELITHNQNLPLAKQKNILEKEFIDWKGSRKQIDDITILGVKV